MTVSEQIIQVLNALCEKFGLVIDWTSANVIPYLGELCGKLVNYEIWTSVAWITFQLMLCIASIVITKKLIPIFKRGIESQGQYDYEWTIGSVFAIIFLVCFYISLTVAFIFEANDIIKYITFPEMYIVEYVQGLISSGG